MRYLILTFTFSVMGVVMNSQVCQFNQFGAYEHTYMQVYNRRYRVPLHVIKCDIRNCKLRSKNTCSCATNTFLTHDGIVLTLQLHWMMANIPTGTLNNHNLHRLLLHINVLYNLIILWFELSSYTGIQDEEKKCSHFSTKTRQF